VRKARLLPKHPADAIAGLEEKYSISLYPGTGTVPGGRSGDHILLAPAYIVTREQIEDIVERTTRVIEDYFSDSAREK
jgi:hypothetical protein